MWIISKKYGMFNTDNILRIEPPYDGIRPGHVVAFGSGRGFNVTEGEDDYQKIIAAILNGDSVVEVS